jgi:hypothetical protein
MTTQTKQPTKPVPVIQMTPPAKSGNIAATGYDAVSKTLAVQFKGGNKLYFYTDVPASLFEDMAKAESIGKFVSAQVVGRYKHTLQVEKDESTELIDALEGK